MKICSIFYLRSIFFSTYRYLFFRAEFMQKHEKDNKIFIEFEIEFPVGKYNSIKYYYSFRVINSQR